MTARKVCGTLAHTPLTTKAGFYTPQTPLTSHVLGSYHARMITVRLAKKNDATAISSVVCDALRCSNAKDYSETVIDRLLSNFTPQRIAEMMSRRTVFVAIRNDQVIGTASLEQATVKTVFVDPEHQRTGVGSRLMNAIEASAREAGLGSLTVASSLTAENFYTVLGYKFLEYKFFGEEKTVFMKRQLAHTD